VFSRALNYDTLFNNLSTSGVTADFAALESGLIFCALLFSAEP
jgi:hypothetical protein